MIKLKLTMDPLLRVLRLGQPLLQSGAYSAEETDRIRDVCKSLAGGEVPDVLPDRMPEWVVHLIDQVSRGGEPPPDLGITCDPEGGPDPDRVKFINAIGHPQVHGRVAYVVRLAIATDLDRPVRQRTVRGKAFPVLTDLQCEERHAVLLAQGPAAQDRACLAEFGDYGTKLALLRSESAWLDTDGYEIGVAAQA